jgi:HD superfamily phosphodiesterase
MTFKERLVILLKLAKAKSDELENNAETRKVIDEIDYLLKQENIELDVSYNLDYLFDDAMKIAASFDGKPVSEFYKIDHPRRDKITVEFERIAEDPFEVTPGLVAELKTYDVIYGIKLCSIGVKEK